MPARKAGSSSEDASEALHSMNASAPAENATRPSTSATPPAEVLARQAGDTKHHREHVTRLVNSPKFEDHAMPQRQNATQSASAENTTHLAIAPSGGALDMPQSVKNTTHMPNAPAREALATTPSPALSFAGLQQSIIHVDKSASLTMFCFAVALNSTVEPWLLAVQLHRGGSGIFGCHGWSVFSDVAVDLGRGPEGWVHAVPIPGQAAWQSQVPGSSEKVWHNTVVFFRAWKRVYDDGFYKAYDWVVKVDPDTVFLPGILQRQLFKRYRSGSFMERLDPERPTYLLNCRQWYSFQGPLEVFNRPAADKFLSGIEQCKAALNWRDWGEDWFVEHCMNFLGVDKREGFGLLDDMYCKSEYDGKGHDYLQEYLANGPTCIDGRPAYHPYKTTDELRLCLEQAAGQED